jgi:hypothetical protein
LEFFFREAVLFFLEAERFEALHLRAAFLHRLVVDLPEAELHFRAASAVEGALSIASASSPMRAIIAPNRAILPATNPLVNL